MKNTVINRLFIAATAVLFSLTFTTAQTIPDIGQEVINVNTKISSNKQHDEIEGRLSVIWEDGSDEQSGSIKFYITTPEGQREIREATEAVARQLENAANGIVRVAGNFETVNGASLLRVTEILESPPQREVSGNTRWAFLLCRFADSTNQTPQTPQQFDDSINDPQFGLDRYWRENSYNKINLANSRVVGWFNLPQPKSYYFYDRNGDGVPDVDLDRMTADATALADNQLYFPDYYGLAFIFNQPLGGAAYGGSAVTARDSSSSRVYGATWIGSSGLISHSLHAHEMGHAFGLPHSTGRRVCPPYCYDSSWDVMSRGASAAFDPRFGTIAPHTIAYHKDLLGWVAPTQKISVNPGDAKSFDLAALQSGSGVIMGLVSQRGVPRFGDVGGVYFTVEARTKLGFDVNIPTAAVVIHRIDPNDYASPARVIVKNVGDDPNGPGGWWLPGDIFNDSATGIKITVNSTTANGFNLSVINPARNSDSDYDGDGRADLAVFRPATGTWYILDWRNGIASMNFGISTDKTVPGDYDGDRKTDIAVYRAGMWYLQNSTEGFAAFSFGDHNDIPQPADYDGDGKTDLAVFRPSNGVWYIYNISLSRFSAVPFGQFGDKPVAADYDGDGKSDVAVFRPSNGVWYLQKTNTLIVFPMQFISVRFGNSADIPVPADYDGDGRTDIAVYRSGDWYMLRSSLGMAGTVFGNSTDVPQPADYDGDGKTDVAVFRPSNGTWYLNRSQLSFIGVQFGQTNDNPANQAVNR
jgi:M6 family metalloprotease-like protein